MRVLFALLIPLSLFAQPTEESHPLTESERDAMSKSLSEIGSDTGKRWVTGKTSLLKDGKEIDWVTCDSRRDDWKEGQLRWIRVQEPEGKNINLVLFTAKGAETPWIWSKPPRSSKFVEWDYDRDSYTPKFLDPFTKGLKAMEQVAKLLKRLAAGTILTESPEMLVWRTAETVMVVGTTWIGAAR